MVAEDSILPASKTLALAQWKILLIFFSHQIDLMYKNVKRVWYTDRDAGTDFLQDRPAVDSSKAKMITE